MSGSQGVGGTNQANNAQLTEQTKAHGKFGKRHIAAIAIGTAIALGGIAATIATGGAFAAGAIGATLFGALFATAGAGALSGILIMTSGIQKGLESRKAEIAKPQQETAKALIENPVEEKVSKDINDFQGTQQDSLPKEGTTNIPDAQQKSIHQTTIAEASANFIMQHASSFAKRMSCDGTANNEVNDSGNFVEGNPNEAMKKAFANIENIKNPKEIIQQPSIVFNDQSTYQAGKDIRRDCKIFNIYGKQVTRNDSDDDNAFFTNVFNKIATQKQETFLKQLLKYPGQLLYDDTISKLNSLPQNQGLYLKTADTQQSRIIISLNQDGTITAQSNIQNCVLNTNEVAAINNQQKCLEKKLCFSSEIIAVITPNDEKFIVTKNTTTLSVADVQITYDKGVKNYTIDTSSTKPVLEMTYTGPTTRKSRLTGETKTQPPTFKITKPALFGIRRTVKTLQCIDDEWKE